MIAKIIRVLAAAVLMMLAASPASAQALDSAGQYTLSINQDVINQDGTKQVGTLDFWGNAYDSAHWYTELTDVIAVTGGLNHSLALKSNGTVVGWGNNNKEQIIKLETSPTTSPISTPPTLLGLTNVKAIAAGARNSLALLGDGTVLAWGDNGAGQSSVPTTWRTATETFTPKATAISAGVYHSMALLSDGHVEAWGAESDSNVTDAGNVNDAIAISAGGYHSLALRSDGTVMAWGTNNVQQTAVPTGLNNAVAVDAGMYHSLALRSDGTIAVWGATSEGQRDGVADLSDVVYITAGSYHSHAVHSDGSITGWGGTAEVQIKTADALNLPTVARWSAGVDGDYLHSHRWAQRIPSTAKSDAVFDQSGTYTVNFGNEARAKNLEISAGKVTFAQNGNAYKVAGEIKITGTDAELHIDGLVTSATVNNAGLLEITSSGALTNSGPLNNTGTLTNFGTLTNGGTFTNSGTFTNTGKLTNKGTFTNTGNFTSTGTLINDGVFDSDLTVTGVLKGNGDIGGSLTIAHGGSLAPGASVGSLYVAGNTTLGPGGIFDFEIDNALGIGDGLGGWDRLQVAGSLNFAAGFAAAIAADPTKRFLVNISTLNADNHAGFADFFDSTRDYSWAFVTADGGIDGFEADYFLINDDGFQNNTYGGNFWISQQGDNNLMLNFDASLSAVPEPSSLAVLSLCGIGWAGYRVRTKKRAKTEVDEAT